LSELGLERLNAGFVLFVLKEQSESGMLAASFLVNSMDRWWANCIRNESEREWVNAQIHRVRREDYKFTDDIYREALQTRLVTGTFQR
jgi:hypothetical protein